jgi:hypothetical protein
MTTVTRGTNRALHDAIAGEGFAFVRGSDMRALLSSAGALDDWPAFADSWNRLELDAYMADGGRYRRRRHATFAASHDGTIARTPHQPHFQPIDYNPLNGGVARWFEPIDPAIGGGASMSAILGFCRTLFEGLTPDRPGWHVEVHQFRIEARQGQKGLPTPEGLHRDGVDFVLVLLINRQNIASGVTSIFNLHGEPLGLFTLTDPFDAALVDDTRVAHGVTPVEPLGPGAPAYRDVLVVTFRRESAAKA